MVVSRYSAWLVSHPITTKTLTAIALNSVAGVVAQTVIEDVPFERIDKARVLRMSAWGLVSAPVIHTWFSTLNRVIHTPGLRGSLQKLLVDQAFFAPSMTTSFYTVSGILEHKSLEQITAKLQSHLWPTILRGYMVWPIANLIMFRFIPVRFNLLFNGSVACLWNTYLCWADAHNLQSGELELDDAADNATAAPVAAGAAVQHVPSTPSNTATEPSTGSSHR